MPAKETAKPSNEPTSKDEPISPADMEVIKQMLLQILQQMQTFSAGLDRLESKLAVPSETHSDPPAPLESPESSTFLIPTKAEIREDRDQLAQPADEHAARIEINKQSPSPVLPTLTPLSTNPAYVNVKAFPPLQDSTNPDYGTVKAFQPLQDSPQALQDIQVAFMPYGNVFGSRPPDLATQRREWRTSYRIRTNLDPHRSSEPQVLKPRHTAAPCIHRAIYAIDRRKPSFTRLHRVPQYSCG